jgi:hypothetical protein
MNVTYFAFPIPLSVGEEFSKDWIPIDVEVTV